MFQPWSHSTWLPLAQDGVTGCGGAHAGAAITLAANGETGSPPDLRFVQTSESTVQISAPTQQLDVAIVAFRQVWGWRSGW